MSGGLKTSLFENPCKKEFGLAYHSCHPEKLGERTYPMPAGDSGEK